MRDAILMMPDMPRARCFRRAALESFATDETRRYGASYEARSPDPGARHGATRTMPFRTAGDICHAAQRRRGHMRVRKDICYISAARPVAARRERRCHSSRPVQCAYFAFVLRRCSLSLPRFENPPDIVHILMFEVNHVIILLSASLLRFAPCRERDAFSAAGMPRAAHRVTLHGLPAAFIIARLRLPLVR